MAKTQQEIEDYYISRGLNGEELRKALEKDPEFQALLKRRKIKIRNKFGISENDEKKYLLPTEEDYKILSMINELEKKNLSENDRDIIEVIRAQLLLNWRSPLIQKLEEIRAKY